MLGQVLGRGLLGQAGAVQEFTLQQGQVCLQGRDDKRAQWEVGGLLKLGMKLLNGQCRVHKPQHKRADAFPDLWGDVAAELLQGGEEALEFAELPCPAGWGQVLCGQ